MDREQKSTPLKVRRKWYWGNIIVTIILHLIAIYGIIFYLKEAQWKTLIFGLIVNGIGLFGVSAGAHRYWSHKSFKAKLPLRIILFVSFCISGQYSILFWARDHRIHHRFVGTDADPYNANRGFIFAHIGWLMQRKHPDVYKKGNLIDCGDIINDPLAAFQKKYCIPLIIFFCFTLPTLIPYYCWNESYTVAFIVTIIRHLATLHIIFCINSVSHIWGDKPYDKRIDPTDNLSMALISLSEGSHNYHHVFPWDYRNAEHGTFMNHLNFVTFFLNLFYLIGWAYDLRQPSRDLVHKTVQRYGDGTKLVFHEENSNNNTLISNFNKQMNDNDDDDYDDDNKKIN